jgi:biopolymer transport protein ExbD
MQFGSQRRDAPRLDMTPLIDVIFQLLLFFMLSTTFRNTPSFEVQLPEVSSDQMIQEDHTWTLMVSETGQLSSQTGTLLKEDLEDVLKGELRTNPNLSLIIEADEGLEHGVVVELMDIAQEAGIDAVQIGATQK